jgi:hypothetical protein
VTVSRDSDHDKLASAFSAIAGIKSSARMQFSPPVEIYKDFNDLISPGIYAKNP